MDQHECEVSGCPQQNLHFLWIFALGMLALEMIDIDYAPNQPG